MRHPFARSWCGGKHFVILFFGFLFHNNTTSCYVYNRTNAIKRDGYCTFGLGGGGVYDDGTLIAHRILDIGIFKFAA